MNLALFDFDGTITDRDTWTGFLRFSATPARLVAASILLSPLIVGYRLGWISARTVRPIIARVAFRGRRADAIGELGRTYAREILPATLQARALDRIAWHKDRGDVVVVVSASLDAYVTAWCASMGIEAICTELEVATARLTGRFVRGECVGGEKTRRIRERYDLDRHPIIYAYGDTDEDREMLELAHEKYYRWNRIADCSSLSSQHPRAAGAS